MLQIKHISTLCFFVSTFGSLSSMNTLDVKTPQGTIIGIGLPVLGLQNATTYQFRRIPYAKPPVGDLRFAKPQPYGPWRGVWNGTFYGPACMQIYDPFSAYLFPNKNMSEDCLLLNVFVPHGVDLTKKKTVMVWIHGGAFETGSGMLYDASYMSAKSDVIVVTINYRLGIFGFFTLQQKSALGNYGLWDQILALEWVQNNIAAFGGDPNNVTIFGESAGGFSVGLHTLIPSNRKLFHRAIYESGVGDSFLSMSNTEGKKASLLVAELLGCHYGIVKIDDFLRCMRDASAQKILNFTTEATIVPLPSVHFIIPLAPVIDGELFTELPQKLLSDPSTDAYKFFKSLDIMVGNCNSEGSLILLILPPYQKRFHFDLGQGIPYDVFCDKIVKTLTKDFFESSTKVADAICKEYGASGDDAEQGRQLVDMYTDLFFIVPSVNTLSAHAGNNTTESKTYQYIFTQKSPKPFGPKRPAWYRGSGHASELAFLFAIRDLEELNITVTKEDLILSDQMITYWTNFAKTGNPDGQYPVSTGTPLTWNPYNIKTRMCMNLNSSLAQISDYDSARVKFWTDDIPKLMKMDWSKHELNT